MATSTILGPTTTLLIAQVSTRNKSVTLASNAPVPNSTIEGRIIYLKMSPQSTLTNSTLSVVCSPGVNIYSTFTQRLLSTNYCVALQETPTNVYTLLNYYTNTATVNNTSPPGASVAVSLPGGRSVAFVDLRTQSKAIVLPSIASLTSSNSQAPYFVVKDLYGVAQVRPLYLSTVGGATFDGRGTTLVSSDNSCAIELVGDRSLNRWHILNYFTGSL